MKPLSLFVALILTSFISFDVNANVKSNVNDAFDKMKSLVGVWHKVGVEEPKLTVSFELIANSSVLVETWSYKGEKHSFTLYHLDNESLLATHYCPQGNQPRLKLAKNSTSNNLRFNFFDATNLINLSDSHQHSLGFQLSKNLTKILRKESYLSDSGENFSELLLVRKK